MRATCRWARTSRCSCTRRPARNTRWRAPSARPAPGYRGFEMHADPGVTLEDDLLRRDLTINAIAQDEAGALIDPHGGQRDLAAKVLRHVSPAFAEDPVRILRVARFAARFAEFTVAPETLALMRAMVEAGEVDALVPERVWQELARGLMERHAVAHVRGAARLRRAGAAAARGGPPVGRAAARRAPPRDRHRRAPDDGARHGGAAGRQPRGALRLPVPRPRQGHDAGRRAAAPPRPRSRSVGLLREVCTRLRVPVDCRELAEMVAREHGNVHRSGELNAAAIVRLLERCDALRRPERFREALLACECDARGRLGLSESAYPQRAPERRADAGAGHRCRGESSPRRRRAARAARRWPTRCARRACRRWRRD